MNRDFKGVWIPKEIWLNSELSLQEKCLLVEIDSLDNDPEKGCFASNDHLSKFIGLSEGRTANIISDLKKKGFIIQCFWDGRNRGLRVNINLSRESSVHENVKADFTNSLKQTSRKREHSNTISSTISNTDNILFPEFSNEVENIFNKILYLFPDRLLPKNPDKWKADIKKLIEIDKRNPEEIIKVITWARKDDFWSTNFLSVMKLRSKNREDIMYYDVFLEQIKCRRENKPIHNPGEPIRSTRLA